MSVQLSSILEHMEALRQVVVEGVEPAASVIDQRAPLREDVGVPDLLHLGPGETILRAGGAVEHETLLWDANRGEARTLRSKEQSHDYRYFPDPDLPPLVIEREWRERIRASLPELPAAKSARFGEQYALAGGHVEVLTDTRELADYYEEAVRLGADQREAANWIMGELLATLKARQCALADFPVRPAELAELLALLASGTLSRPIARQVFERMMETGRAPSRIVEEEGLTQVRDEGAIERWVEEVVAAHPAEAERVRAGEARLLGFLVGQVMRRSGGRAEPGQVNRVLDERLRG